MADLATATAYAFNDPVARRQLHDGRLRVESWQAHAFKVLMHRLQHRAITHLGRGDSFEQAGFENNGFADRWPLRVPGRMRALHKLARPAPEHH